MKKQIAISVDSRWFLQLKAKLNEPDDVKVMQTAYSLLDWAADEISNSRVLLSCSTEFKQIDKLNMDNIL